jgi:hypothetical protein
VRTITPLIGFVALVGGMGAVHGVRTDRWTPSAELQTAIASLGRVPADVGEWHGEDVAVDPEDLARGGIRGSVYRTYTHRTSGATLSVLLVCGRGGPISAHTPDVCYTGIGYQMTARRQRLAVTDADAFWSGPFAKADAVVPQRLEIYWAWSRDGQVWAAPDNERAAFARHPAVFKLYVVRAAPLSSRPDEAVVRDFLGRLLPALRAVLGPGAAQ